MSNPPTSNVNAELAALRDRIDALDRQLIAVVAERLQVCHEVAAVKEDLDAPIIQPARVRTVVEIGRAHV